MKIKYKTFDNANEGLQQLRIETKNSSSTIQKPQTTHTNQELQTHFCTNQ